MTAFKSMLKICRVELAKRQRTCRHNRSRKITRGESCLVVLDGPFERSCYCTDVALAMVEQARKRLSELETVLIQGQQTALNHEQSP